MNNKYLKLVVLGEGKILIYNLKVGLEKLH